MQRNSAAYLSKYDFRGPFGLIMLSHYLRGASSKKGILPTTHATRNDSIGDMDPPQTSHHDVDT